MIINKIILNNFGVFSGKNELLLNPINKSRPIILFAGMNGSGKTTVFDAIKLCLYGHNLMEQNSNGKYKEYLRSKIHWSKDLVVQPYYASIGVEFQYSRYGQVNTYLVEREWEDDYGKITESLNVKRDGKILDDIEKDNWQEFVKELIPIGLYHLFFFDGEKIQKMMSYHNNEELKRSIKALIGLDLMERLKADLKIYKVRYLKKNSTVQFGEELEGFDKKINFINAQIMRVEDKRSKLSNTILKTKTDIENYKRKIAAQGGMHLENQNQLQVKKLTLEKEIDVLKDKIRELCVGLLPVSIASKYAVRLKKQIITEHESQKNEIVSALVTERADKILTTINGKEFFNDIADVNTQVLNKVRNYFGREIKNLISELSLKKGIELIHGLSQNQTSKLLYNIDCAVTVVPDELKKLTKEYEKKYREMQKTLVDLQKAPDDGLIKSMYQTLSNLNKELGSLENEDRHQVEELSHLKNNRNEIERKKNIVEKKLEENRKTDTKIILVNKTEKVLSSYNKELAGLKSRSLSNEFMDIFSRLHRKREMIEKIKIDPETFDVVLYNKKNKIIDKGSLSSGELEIYSMSMVWALARISGQKLPFIIDTPLGRLDSQHRDNLLNIFFPNASHQMLIFSTDTEVDKKYFNILKPSVSKAYTLEYSDHKKFTRVKKGYFWN